MKFSLALICGTALTAFAQTARNPLEEMRERLATPEPLPHGPALMARVRDRLPPMPLRMTGEIETRRDRTTTTRGLVSELRFGAEPPRAGFSLSDAFGSALGRFVVEWRDGTPHWFRDGAPIEAPRELADTGLSGEDLALAFLWWAGAEVAGIERVRARDAYVVDIPAPPPGGKVASVRLWIDKRALFVVEAEVLNAEGDPLRRIEVDRLKKVREGLWMVQDLVVRDFEHDRRIKIRFEEVEERP